MNPIYAFRRRVDKIIRGLCFGAAAFGVSWLAMILFTLFYNGLAGISLQLFTQNTPPPASTEGGLLNAIVGSIIMTIIGVGIGAPIGMFAPTYLAEYGRHDRLTSVIRFINDILLSAPSIIIGLFIYGAVVVPMGSFSALAGSLALAVIGNVAIANHAYDIGEHVPAFCLALLSFFILWYDLRRIVALLVFRRDTAVVRYYPSFSKTWQRYGRLALKWSGNFVFVILFGLSETYAFTHNDFYKLPRTTGLAGAKGYYHVTAFRLNDKEVPYSPDDSVRWQDATFEDWSSLSFRVAHRPSQIEMFAAGSYPRVGEPYTGKWTIGLGDTRRFEASARKAKRLHDFYDDPVTKRDIGTNWEMSGLGSDRKWYFYQADTVQHVLYLQNKNKYERSLRQVLHYSRPSADRIVLWGTNEFRDSIYVVLDRDTATLPLLRDGRKPVPDWLVLKK